MEYNFQICRKMIILNYNVLTNNIFREKQLFREKWFGFKAQHYTFGHMPLKRGKKIWAKNLKARVKSSSHAGAKRCIDPSN
jgi:hypothetical protein